MLHLITSPFSFFNLIWINNVTLILLYNYVLSLKFLALYFKWRLAEVAIALCCSMGSQSMQNKALTAWVL